MPASTLRALSALKIPRRSLMRLALLGVLSVASPALSANGSVTVDPAILRAVDTHAGNETERRELRTIYEGVGGQLLWATPERRFTLVKLLVSLEMDGIGLERLGTLPGVKITTPASEDVLASRAVLRAVHVMGGDGADSETIPGWRMERAPLNVVAGMIAAANEDKLGTLLQDFRPTAADYQRLQRAYLHYRRLAEGPWHLIDTSGPRVIEVDDERRPQVVHRLQVLGDLEDGEPHDAALAAGIKRFQSRHGLEPDGRVGPSTLEQMNISPQTRAEQIAVNLVYWRWLPRAWPNRYVSVNTASAHLDVIENGRVTFTTRVIVGDRAHPTPMLAANITAVTFNPPWTVPRSIATKEILPRLQRDSSYLARNNIEIVGRADDPHGVDVDWRRYTRNTFPFQLRQRPGARNALGLVKFEMPNQADVYLHDTPDRSLFDKSSRALSHGCVRVQGPQGLAEHLLADPAIWLSSNLITALQEGRTFRVALKQELPVYLLYFTSFVDADGTVQFRPDIYHRDGVARRSLPVFAVGSP